MINTQGFPVENPAAAAVVAYGRVAISPF